MTRQAFGLVAMLAIALLLDAPAAAESAPVKKSRSGICHCPGGQYYGKTKSFTPFNSVKACLDSGGRHPKRGQGDCGKAAPAGKTKDGKRSARPATRAKDGDTLTLNGVTVRLQGIDAPESGQSCRNARDRSYPCGATATAALRLMMSAGGVRCDFEPETGRYGRRIGYCYLASHKTAHSWSAIESKLVGFKVCRVQGVGHPDLQRSGAHRNRHKVDSAHAKYNCSQSLCRASACSAVAPCPRPG